MRLSVEDAEADIDVVDDVDTVRLRVCEVVTDVDTETDSVCVADCVAE